MGGKSKLSWILTMFILHNFAVLTIDSFLMLLLEKHFFDVRIREIGISKTMQRYSISYLLFCHVVNLFVLKHLP